MWVFSRDFSRDFAVDGARRCVSLAIKVFLVATVQHFDRCPFAKRGGDCFYTMVFDVSSGYVRSSSSIRASQREPQHPLHCFHETEPTD